MITKYLETWKSQRIHSQGNVGIMEKSGKGVFYGELVEDLSVSLIVEVVEDETVDQSGLQINQAGNCSTEVSSALV